jgi:glutathione S-transferase
MASPLPILYSFRRCPYAMRARLALLSSGQSFELREIVLSQKPPEMLAASPKGTVPVLLLPDGQVIEQSLEVMQWTLQLADPDHWLPQDATHATHEAELIARCDAPFKADLDRYKYPNRYALPDGSVHRAQGAEFLQALEVRLAVTQFLSGTHFGLADAAIAPFVRQFAHTDPQWFAAQTWPRLQGWLQAFEDSTLFAQAMVKVRQWAPGQPATVFTPQKTLLI